MIRILGVLPTCPPLNTGGVFGYLTSDGNAQNLLPYPEGTSSGDLMLGFLPWLCQSAYYGDAFIKWSNASQLSQLDGEVLYRFLDGTEGTIPGEGKIVYGLAGAEYGRPTTDLITGVSVRGVDSNATPVFKIQSIPTSSSNGNGTYTYETTTQSFVASQNIMVVCAQYVRATNFDSGDPDYIPSTATLEWDGSPTLDLLSESMCQGPSWRGGWRVSSRRYAAGATVPDIIGKAVGNASASDCLWQLVVCVQEGSDTTTDTTPPTTTASPPPGNYATTQSVILSTDEDARILYTMDGSTPSISSRVITSRISGAQTISVSCTPWFNHEALTIHTGTTLKVSAIDSFGNVESVQSMYYRSLDTTPPTTTVSLSNGIHPAGTTLTISDVGTDDSTPVRKFYRWV